MKLARERQGARNDLNIPQKSAGSCGEARQALADMTGVSSRTLDKVERIEAEAFQVMYAQSMIVCYKK